MNLAELAIDGSEDKVGSGGSGPKCSRNETTSATVKNSVYVSRLNVPHHLRRLKASTRTKTMPRDER